VARTSTTRSATKRQASSRRPAPGGAPGGAPAPGWIWGLGGLAAGLSVALLVHVYHQDRGGVAGLEGLLPDPPAAGAPPAAPTDEPSRPAPQFEFYRLLPQQEVVVPEPEPLPPRETARDTGAQPATEPASSSARYLLQAGSFRSGEDAERLKARLALLGIEAGIQTVELAGGETWHRVRVGPLPAGERLNQVRARLERNAIESILLKRGG